jgi:hypothetical protein
VKIVVNAGVFDTSSNYHLVFTRVWNANGVFLSWTFQKAILIFFFDDNGVHLWETIRFSSTHKVIDISGEDSAFSRGLKITCTNRLQMIFVRRLALVRHVV